LKEIIQALKTDPGFLYLVILILVVLPMLVIIHYLNENRIISFPKPKTGLVKKPMYISALLSLAVMTPFIFIYKFSMILSAGLILMFALLLLPVVTFYSSKGKEPTFDSNNRPVPRYGQLNTKRRVLGTQFMLLFIANMVSVFILDRDHVPIDKAFEIYFFGIGMLSMPLAVYFTQIIECEYCSCLNFRGMTKVCKYCSIPFRNS